MNIKLTLGLLAVSLTACHDTRQTTQTTTEQSAAIDTIVGSKTITDEIPGAVHRKRATGYFVMVAKDTSDYSCIFTESKDSGKVSIDLNIPYFKAAMTYRQRLSELQLMLPKAAADFNFDSLTAVYFGRLILHGDLAVEVTKQYHQKFGASDKLESYTAVGQFLKESKLGADLDNLFKKYSISVEKVSIEKLFFTSRQELYWASKIETDTANVPDKLLDCMIWVKLQKSKNNYP